MTNCETLSHLMKFMGLFVILQRCRIRSAPNIRFNELLDFESLHKNKYLQTSGLLLNGVYSRRFPFYIVCTG